MATHLAGFFGSIDSTTLTRLTTLQDDVLTPSGTQRYLVPDVYDHIQFAFATGVNLSQARIVSPSLEVEKSDLDINPITDGADLLTNADPSIWIPGRPVPLVPTESFEVTASEDGGGATTAQAFVALGTPENDPMPSGVIRSVRATGTTTMVPDGWTACTLTLESSLQAGRYTLVHFAAFGATCVAARWIPQGGGFRPGLNGFSGASPNQFDWNPSLWQRMGWYSMLEFTHITIPQIQFFCTAGDTAQTVQMYVIRTGDS